jgi:hypothetical protein
MLPIGTKVFMSQVGKNRYKEAYNNPHSGVGTVAAHVEVGHFCYRVHWDRPSTNVYRIDDLNPVVVNKELEDYL